MDTLIALAQKIPGQSQLNEPFKKYFAGGEPSGWKKNIDEVNTRGGASMSLGGNAANTFSVTLPDGTKVVTKEIHSDAIQRQVEVLKQLEQWSAEGRGPKILGVSLLPGQKRSERKLFLVMENLFAPKNDLGTKILAGNGAEVRLLRGESEPARKWLMNRMLSILATHPDPHPMNVIFRVSQLDPQADLPPVGSYYREGNKIYQAFLIDPSGVDGSPEDSLFNGDISKTPPALLQYNQEWKQRFFQREMGF